MSTQPSLQAELRAGGQTYPLDAPATFVISIFPNELLEILISNISPHWRQLPHDIPRLWMCVIIATAPHLSELRNDEYKPFIKYVYSHSAYHQ
ncbi:hypothetical protein FIBSPDRAFT_851741 [Athelia psychrophila]|uniref:Uncharacterized protein n=1 Tax=Athelia psychrophila TaxID=1759441 RepID=A0A166SE13_9AGAM|nr:hypothetical protein FIBSPDRAFT_851741 [Fibularhizoctonia sp. CBS 109695]